MRLIVTAVLLSIAAASPASAQSRDRTQEVARALQNPIVQEGLATVIGNLAGIVFDTEIGPLARYADPEEDIRQGDTLRDYQHRRDPGFEARLHNGTRRAVAAAGVAAGDALAMRASVEESAARLRAALAPLRDAIDSYSGN